MSNIFKELGWHDKDLQTQIKLCASQTRESMKHLVVRMLARTGFREGELYISIDDHRGMSNAVLTQSDPIYDRDELHDKYHRLIKALDLPFCCHKHKEMLEPEFDFSDPDEAEFDFSDPDEDGFDFSEDEVGTDEEFDFSDPDEEPEFDFS